MAFVQGAYNEVSSAHPTVGTLSLSAGNTNIVIATNYTPGGSREVSSVTDTAGNTYSRCGSVMTFTGHADVKGEAWIVENAIAEESNVVTITYAGGVPNSATCFVLEYSGLPEGAFNAQSAFTVTASSTTHNSPSITTTEGDCFVLGVFYPLSTVTFSAGSNSVLRLSSTPSPLFAVSESPAPDAGTNTTQITTSAAVTTEALAFAFRDEPEPEPESPTITETTRLQSGKPLVITVTDASASGNTVILSPTTDHEHEDAETQTIDAESATEITTDPITLPDGIGAGDGLYLFVVDDDDNVSAPFPLLVSDPALRLDAVGDPAGNLIVDAAGDPVTGSVNAVVMSGAAGSRSIVYDGASVSVTAGAMDIVDAAFSIDELGDPYTVMIAAGSNVACVCTASVVDRNEDE